MLVVVVVVVVHAGLVLTKAFVRVLCDSLMRIVIANNDEMNTLAH